MNLKNYLDNIKSFYLKNKNTIIILTLISLVILTLISIRSCKNNNLTKNQLKIANDSLNMKIKDYVDENNKYHAQIRQLELSNAELKSVNSNLEIYYKSKIDSISKILKIKSSQIVEYLSIINSAKGSGTTPIIKQEIPTKEEIKRTYKFGVKDSYLTFDGILNSQIDSLTYEYTYSDKLLLTNFYKRKGILGWRKEYYWDATLSNPNAKIIGLEQFKKVKTKYNNWVVSVGTSYGFDSKFKLGWQPITLTLGYKLFEF